MENKREEWRLYYFTNMYIVGIHAGIQGIHSGMHLIFKYVQANNDKDGQKKFDMLLNWHKQHETVIVLNGGDSQNMGKLRGILENKNNPYPHAAFKEPGAGNLLTSMCILLPDRIFDKNNRDIVKRAIEDIKFFAVADHKDLEYYNSLSEWERNFILEMSKCPLAN